MRISSQQVFSGGLDNIQNINTQLQKTQLQISSGKRVVTPSDDPVASTRILQINQELALVDQYQTNIKMAEARLNQEDTLLSSVNDVIIRLRELTINAGDGALSGDDLKFIAAEVKQRLEQLAGIMNSQDPSGEFVFAGFQGNSQPFVKNVSGAYEYKGDEGQRLLQVDTNVRVAIGDTGKALFVDVDSYKNTFYTEANPRNTATPPAVISPGMVVDQAAFDQFYSKDMVVTFKNGVTGLEYDITERESGRVLASDQTYASGTAIVLNGVQFDVSGDPDVGDEFFVTSAPKQGLLTTTEKFVYALENFNITPEGRASYADALATLLQNFDNAQTNVLEARSQLGARLNTLDTTGELLADVKLLTQENLSELQDVDYAEAVSKLQFENFVLQAAQSSFALVSRLSLFDQL